MAKLQSAHLRSDRQIDPCSKDLSRELDAGQVGNNWKLEEEEDKKHVKDSQIVGPCCGMV